MFSMLKAAGIGAGLMYLYDPAAGKRRRAQLRDQLNSLVHRTTEGLYHFVDVGQRDLRNRTQGLVHEGRARLEHEEVPDSLLRERVRAALGHYVTNARAIDVEVHDGCVVLSGPVLAHEAPRLLSAIGQVRGVHDVDSRLDVHDQPDIPQLVGSPPRAATSCRWTPGTRLIATALGGALMTNCVLRRTPTAMLLGTVGFGLFLRATSDRPIDQIAHVPAPQTDKRRQHLPQSN